jgi:Ser/Thr protein kinase RdoA (MazF antagonist)
MSSLAPDWPRLTKAELTSLLAQYPDLGDFRGIVWHSRRPFAASALIACDRAPVFVKRHDPRVRSAADLREEHGFIAHLRAHGAAVPRVLADEAGETALAREAGVYEIHALGDGEDRYRDVDSWHPVENPADARAAGVALARLHQAAEAYAAPARSTRRVVAGDTLLRAADPQAALHQWMAADAMLADALAGRDWRADFTPFLRPFLHAQQAITAALPFQWVHGDLHVSNALWRDGAVSTVLDFGLSNRASAIFDLTTAIERNAIAWLDLSPTHRDIGRADLACALVDGYAATLPVPDLHAVRAILPVVHVDFALSELAYFHGITQSGGNAALAYDTFLLGHAAWFGTAQGQIFLDRLA